ncbi:MAG: hypothetical protein WD295_01470, partial [Bacteroidota bacterium]
KDPIHFGGIDHDTVATAGGVALHHGTARPISCLENGGIDTKFRNVGKAMFGKEWELGSAHDPF